MSEQFREIARIGSDVIAASMQADQIARWSLNGFGDQNHETMPLGIFAMTRSSIYGLHYLYNIKNVRDRTKTKPIEKFLKICEKNWNITLLSQKFGKIEFERRERLDNWDKLSEVVHIIPTIREKGGTRISHKVNFSFEDSLNKPSKHAYLPEYFTQEGEGYLHWRSKIAIGCMVGFKSRFSELFSEKSHKKNVYQKLKDVVLIECNDYIRGINDLFEEDLSLELMELSDKMF